MSPPSQAPPAETSAADPVDFRPKDEPLREDVRALGALLGTVLQEHGPPGLYDAVESARHHSRRRRAGEADAEDQLAAGLRALDPPRAGEVARAFSAYFELVNLAERVHRLRRRIDYLRDPARPQPGSLEACLEALRAAKVGPDAVAQLLGRLRIEPVFTAHPTEAVRRTLLRKEQRIARALVDRIEAGALGPRDQAVILGRVHEEVAVAWQTDEDLHVRPEVADEVEHVTFYLAEVVYRIVPAFYEGLRAALSRAYGEQAPAVPAGVLRFSSWVGGDMDGNPNVGAETVRATLARQRSLVLRRYHAEVGELAERLSHAAGRVSPGVAFSARLEALRSQLEDAQAAVSPRYRSMPYRVFLLLVQARLEATHEDRPEGYRGPAEFLEDLRTLATSLEQGAAAGGWRVRRLIERVETFGFHLASLDVREEAAAFRAAAQWAAEHGGGQDAGAPGGAARGPGAPPEVERLVRVMDALRDLRGSHGVGALGLTVLSMARGPEDTRAVLQLARARGLLDEDGQVPLDVAPLFETVDDLAQAPETMRTLFEDPEYRRHLAARGEVQHVMLGYSDSAKMGGLVASRVALDRAQRALVALGNEFEVEVALFHGRGGSASRGGTHPRAAVLAGPPGSVRGRVRVTEQGEVIDAKYGLRGLATRTLELLAGATLERLAGAEDAAPPPGEWQDAARRLADEARAAYHALVQDPDLPAYFRAATPIDVIERMNMGSRPPSRRKGGGVESLRAIPWVFAWTQSRHLMPGWYGVGTALRAALDRDGVACWRQRLAAWPLLETMISDVEMVLAKADLEIASRYAELAGALGPRFLPRMREEYERTREAVLQLLDAPRLLERDPVLRRAIRLRNPYVDPLSFLQVDLLARWRAGGREDPALERVLFTTVRGIARGLKNTG